MERNSFIFYKSFYEASKYLPNEEKGKLFDMICQYGLYGNEIEGKGASMGMFLLIKPQLDANNKRYENGCKGGAPEGNQNAVKTWKNNTKQPKNNQKQPNDNDNVNDNEKEKEKERGAEKNSGTTELVERLKNYQLSPDIINLIHEFDKCKKGQKLSKMDDTQLKRWVNKLKKLGLDNDEGMKRVIENSIVNGWQGIFELKGEDKKIAESSKEPKTDMDYVELYHKYYLEYKEKELKEKWGDDKYYEIRRKWLEWCASK